jgi:hypothetical protein
MKELNLILEALQFLLGQHTNDVDPATAFVAQRHLGNVRSLASDVNALENSPAPAAPAAPAPAPPPVETVKSEPAKVEPEKAAPAKAAELKEAAK